MTKVEAKLKALVRALAPQVTAIYAAGDEISTTYTFYTKDDKVMQTLTEAEVGRKVEELGLDALARATGSDADQIAKAVHHSTIRFVRMLLMRHEEVLFLTVHGEVWVTTMKDGEENRRYEMMHYMAHSRMGENVMALQSILRPAGHHPTLVDDLTFVDESPDHPEQQMVGEMMKFFPVQLSSADRRKEMQLMRSVRKMKKRFEEKG